CHSGAGVGEYEGETAIGQLLAIGQLEPEGSAGAGKGKKRLLGHKKLGKPNHPIWPMFAASAAVELKTPYHG
nr:hypothetical protein [Tanacetum cinerariifolium]